MADINIVHELTMLYLRQKDISDLSPSELLDKYQKTYKEIKEHKTKTYGTKWPY